MELYFSRKYWIWSFVIFFNTTFFQQTNKSITFNILSSTTSAETKFLLSNQANTERRITIGVQLIVWVRSWLRLKSPGFRLSLAIYYCTKSVWFITLDLNVVSSLFGFLIACQWSPWYFLVCYVQDITPKTRGLFVTYFHYTVIIATVSYQYCSYLWYRDIHMRTYTHFYFPLNYYNRVILDIFHFKLS